MRSDHRVSGLIPSWVHQLLGRGSAIYLSEDKVEVSPRNGLSKPFVRVLCGVLRSLSCVPSRPVTEDLYHMLKDHLVILLFPMDRCKGRAFPHNNLVRHACIFFRPLRILKAPQGHKRSPGTEEDLYKMINY